MSLKTSSQPLATMASSSTQNLPVFGRHSQGGKKRKAPVAKKTPVKQNKRRKSEMVFVTERSDDEEEEAEEEDQADAPVRSASQPSSTSSASQSISLASSQSMSAGSSQSSSNAYSQPSSRASSQITSNGSSQGTSSSGSSQQSSIVSSQGSSVGASQPTTTTTTPVVVVEPSASSALAVQGLTYRQVQNELKVRRLTGKGTMKDLIERLKVAYTIEEQRFAQACAAGITTFSMLPNEIYLELFEYMSTFDVVFAFYHLTSRLSSLIASSPRLTYNLDGFSKTNFKRALKQLALPEISSQFVSLRTSSSRDVLTTSWHDNESLFKTQLVLPQFENLRELSVYARTHDEQLDSIFESLPQMPSLEILHIGNTYHYTSNEIRVCKFTLANTCRDRLRDPFRSGRRSGRLTHVSLDAVFPFGGFEDILERLARCGVADLTYVSVRIMAEFLYASRASTFLKMNSFLSLVPNATYLKVMADAIDFESTIDFIGRFPPTITHLSIWTGHWGWEDGERWGGFLETLDHVKELDLDLLYTKSMPDEDMLERLLATFRTPFWQERKWDDVQAIFGRFKTRFVRRSSSQ